MSSTIEELYQEVILDNFKNPKNKGVLKEYTHYSQGYNPLCGDQLAVYLNIGGDAINNLSFDGDGCAISVASSSLLFEKIKKMNIGDAECTINIFRKLIMGDYISDDETEQLGKLMVFSNINKYPSRVKCAILGGHAMLAALRNDKDCTTE